MFQGDNLKPNLFNVFINDIVKSFDESCKPISLGSKPVSCLLYADDLLLISETETGLQNCMDKVFNYCSTWGLDINYQKTKVMVFNRGSKLHTPKLLINGHEIESVNQYKYLGVLFSLNGNFKCALNDVYSRGLKAFFKIPNLFKNIPCDINNFMYIFDHTVKPVLLYSSEILGMFNIKSSKKHSGKDDVFEQIYNLLLAEKTNLTMCRYLLGVNKKTCKLALYGELGRYPLYINIIMNMIKYWLRLYQNTGEDSLLHEALAENIGMVNNNQDCWLSCIENIFNECSLSHLYRNPRSIKNKNLLAIKKFLETKFEKSWSQKLSNSEKLRTYRKFKNIFKFEKIFTICS